MAKLDTVSGCNWSRTDILLTAWLVKPQETGEWPVVATGAASAVSLYSQITVVQQLPRDESNNN